MPFTQLGLERIRFWKSNTTTNCYMLLARSNIPTYESGTYYTYNGSTYDEVVVTPPQQEPEDWSDITKWLDGSNAYYTQSGNNFYLVTDYYYLFTATQASGSSEPPQLGYKALPIRSSTYSPTPRDRGLYLTASIDAVSSTQSITYTNSEDAYFPNARNDWRNMDIIFISKSETDVSTANRLAAIVFDTPINIQTNNRLKIPKYSNEGGTETGFKLQYSFAYPQN